MALKLFRRGLETPATGLPRAFLVLAGAFCEAACMLQAVCLGGNGRGSAVLCSLLVARTVGAS